MFLPRRGTGHLPPNISGKFCLIASNLYVTI